ncbi:SGNH/GDSL hydrolase family protein [Actinomyces sp. W5033]|uniref:SGNH/GDSL hydrolase family protein n=1 Tax=Actinomyces sp. W5033 TaxID=3446479 RepID=UPI003EDFE875
MPSLPRPLPHPTAVFFGDSVTTGWQAVTHPRNRWSSLVCEHLRWREVNLAADGMGFFARRGGHLPGGGRAPSCQDTTWLEAVVRAEPDLVTVSLGLNDAPLLPSHLDLVRQAVEHDLSFLASRLRGVPVIVAPYFPALGTGPRFEVVRRLVHEQATTLGLVSTDAMSLAIDAEADRLSIDGIHPDDAGHAAIARAMIHVYEQLVPALCSPGPGQVG